MKDTTLLLDSKFRLERKDFVRRGESHFHLLVFATIENLIDKGLTTIDAIDIDEYLSEYPDKHQIFEENDGLEWCFSAVEITNENSYSYYAEKIKKFSLLRSLVDNGIDISDIYDIDTETNSVHSDSTRTLEEKSIDDLIKFFQDKVEEVTGSYEIGYNRQASKAGDKGIELLESFKEAPVYGFNAIGNMQNTIYRGILPKNTYLRSALTNVGKSRTALGEATDLAIDKWYVHSKKLKDSEGSWQPKSSKRKVLFISTEMEEDELQPTMWAYVSGVAEEKIKDGRLTEHEEQIVKEAILHLQECDLFIEYVPKFDPQTINAIVKEYAMKHGIEVVFFDYVHLSFEVMIEMNRHSGKMNMREDMILNMFMSGLEEMAREYNFHLRTATQMNGEQVDPNTQVLDQRLLRGAKSMGDKVQYGVIMAVPSEKELEQVEGLIDLKEFTRSGQPMKPNVVHHIYKNRRSKYKGKLWLYVDYDTMRVKELFFTNFNNEKVNVPLTELV